VSVVQRIEPTKTGEGKEMNENKFKSFRKDLAGQLKPELEKMYKRGFDAGARAMLKVIKAYFRGLNLRNL